MVQPGAPHPPWQTQLAPSLAGTTGSSATSGDRQRVQACSPAWSLVAQGRNSEEVLRRSELRKGARQGGRSDPYPQHLCSSVRSPGRTSETARAAVHRSAQLWTGSATRLPSTASLSPPPFSITPFPILPPCLLSPVPLYPRVFLLYEPGHSCHLLYRPLGRHIGSFLYENHVFHVQGFE